jgi:hypothetical protein
MRTGFISFLLFIAFFQLTSFAQYFTRESAEIKTLSKGADVILTGKVVKQKSEWNADKTRILTRVTVEVDDYLKTANHQKDVIVTHLGGEVGSVGEWYSHVPRFKNDEDVLLFLKKDNLNGAYKVVDGENGKWTLYKDDKTGEKITSSFVKISALKKEIKNYVK